MNIFEQASRCALTFTTEYGTLDASDLWKLPLVTNNKWLSLGKVAKQYHAALKASEEASFVEDTPAVDGLEQLRFDIILHIIKVKKDQQLAAAREREVAAKRQKIMEIIERKSDEALSASSIEELRSMLEAL